MKVRPQVGRLSFGRGVRAALAVCVLGAMAGIAAPVAIEGSGATTTATTCTFNGVPGIAQLTGVMAGSTVVSIVCKSGTNQIIDAAMASPLGGILIAPGSAINEGDLGTLITLTETPKKTGTTYTGSITVPNPFTTKPQKGDPSAVCPVSAGQFNAGLVGCPIAVITSALAPIPGADAILEYSSQPANKPPNSPTLASASTSVSPGEHITFSDATGACPDNPTATSRCWWGDGFFASSTAAKSLSVTLDGKAVAGAAAIVTGPGASGDGTWNWSSKTKKGTLVPQTLSGSLTLPSSLSFGTHTLTVTQNNVTTFFGNEAGAKAGSPISASLTLHVVAAQGFWLATANGSVFATGIAPVLPGTHVPSTDPVVGIASTATGKGFWLVTANGTVFASGDAKSHGDLPGLGVKVSDIVAIAPTGDGGGYWMIGRDGGEFAFGDAKYHGSLPGLHIHVDNIVGMVATSDSGGYWIVGSDGGVFAFGDTHFVGSLPGLHIHVNDIRAMIPSPTREGYVLVGSDGGAFVFGSGVHFYGSLPGEHIKVSDIVGLALTPPTLGYWFAGANGVTYPFGDAENLPVSATVRNNLPVVGIAVSNLVVVP